MMDIGNAAQWASAVISLGAFGLSASGLYIAVRATRSKANQEAISAVKVSEAEARIALKTELTNSVEGVKLDVRRCEDNMARAFERIDQAEQRYVELKNELRHLPDKDQVHKLELSNSRIEGKVDRLFERVEPIRNIAWRLQEDALDQARAKSGATA